MKLNQELLNRTYPEGTTKEQWDIAKSNVEKYAKEKDRLEEKYKLKIIKANHITQKQMEAIGLEGIEKDWPYFHRSN